MKERKTRDVSHTGGGGKVRVPVELSFAGAAGYAAGIVARREYGKRGYCRTCRLDSWTDDGASATFEAFIGVPGANMHTTVGRNIWIYV